MKRILMVFLCCGLFASLPSYAQQMARWDLARDLQRSFTQGADGVWYFMESEAMIHDPAVYRLLPRYLAPCHSQTSGVAAGVGCWQGTEAHTPGPGYGLKTEVAFNFTDKLVGSCDPVSGDCPDPLPGYLPHWARLVATWDRSAIVAWQSPLRGFVNVSARFRLRPLPAIQTSVFWAVDKGNETLRSGQIGVGLADAALVNISSLNVIKGDVLYFIVDDSFHADDFSVIPTDLIVTITQVQ